MSNAKPQVVNKKGINPIWFFPVAAVSIGIWLLYTNLMARGSYITINFRNADGIIPGKTTIIYKGTIVGRVKDTELNENLTSVAVHVEMNPRMREYLSKDTKFWLVSPTVNLSGISGLSTIISGKFINMHPAKGKFIRKFDALNETPRSLRKDGIYIKLNADKLGPISIGSPIYYNKIQVGEVTGYDLDMERDGVDITVFIEDRYQNLIHSTSRFYNVSGISVDASLAGVKVRTESLASLVRGGISFVNFESDDETILKENFEKSYKLYSSYEETIPGKEISIEFPLGSAVSKVKTPIKFRSIIIGYVTGSKVDRNKSTLTVQANIKKEFEKVVVKGAQFWEVKPKISLSGIESLDALTGNYIAVDISRSRYRKSKETDRFKALRQAPLKEVHNKYGQRLSLYSDRRNSLAKGQGVYYRGIQVGVITDVRLNTRAKNVIADIFVNSPYHRLLKEETKFWNVSGVDVEFGLFSGAKISTQSLETLLSGGVEFATPEKFSQRKKDYFRIHKKADKDWLEWKPIIEL
ncbi:intermembrane transport protein PqiB [Halobacteriovorax sp. RT-2-6]|uniref:PqiB family protein n=1 Tax=unclassified Halobacteriovorax TaxID=2639665 RepID=UPI00399BD737